MMNADAVKSLLIWFSPLFDGFQALPSDRLRLLMIAESCLEMCAESLGTLVNDCAN